MVVAGVSDHPGGPDREHVPRGQHPTPCREPVGASGRRGARPSESPVTVRRSVTNGASQATDATPTRSRSTQRKTVEDTRARTGIRTIVLDTSVLLADPGAFLRFAEHEVVLPLVVITEIEAKRHHPELGCFARRSLRSLAA